MIWRKKCWFFSHCAILTKISCNHIFTVDFTKYFSNENKPLIVLICNVFLSYLEVDGFSADWALLIDVRCLLWGDEITEFSLTQSASFSSWRVESLRDDRLKSSKSKLSSSAALKTRKRLFWFWKRARSKVSCCGATKAQNNAPARRLELFVYFLILQVCNFLWKWVNSICSDFRRIWKGKGKC